METMIIAVVVTYNPDFSALELLLSELSKQASLIVLIDNGSLIDVSDWAYKSNFHHIVCISLKKNQGLASAQNIGIKYAIDNNYQYIVLFDQDSLPDEYMINNLVIAHESLSTQKIKVGAVGPTNIADSNSGRSPFSQIVGLKHIRKKCTSENGIVETDYLISSGCLFSVNTLRLVGLMEEKLFIDYIDIEWCLRAKSSGYKVFGVCSAKMKHSLGDSPLVIFGKKYPVHSPLRHYYIFRNAMWLYSRTAAPWNWKAVDLFRLIIKFLAYAIFAKPRYQHLKMMTIGVFHGLVGKSGNIDNANAR
jgi:rhamnosyltransferase